MCIWSVGGRRVGSELNDAGCMSASNASLGPQKVYHCRDSAYWIFFVRDMAEIGENDNPAARDITVETFCVVRRDQSVTASPHYKRRYLKLGDSGGIGAEIRLRKSLDQCVAIPARTVISKYRSTSAGVTLDGSP